MGKRSSLAVLSRFHRNSGAGGSAALRGCDFYDDRAVGRDVRRKIEFWLDPAAAVGQAMQRMQTVMDSSDHGQQTN